MSKKKFALVICFVLVAMLPTFALYNRQGIPDSSEIRRRLVEEWFTASVDSVRANVTELHINNAGTVFQVRAEENGRDLIVIVAPQDKLKVDVYSETGKHSSYVDVYPVDSPGSWVLLRDIDTGNPLQIRYYFAADSDVFIQLSPYGEKTVADFVVFGSYAARGVPVGIPFKRLYTASFAEVYSLTKNTLPWEYTDIMPGLYHPVKQMIAVVRENLDRFFYAEDGAYDEDGNPVFISTGRQRVVEENVLEEEGLSFSSAGFLKWIVDGLVMPLAGSYTLINPLLVPTVEYKQGSFSDVISQRFNISFSLDWTRNLASAALSVYSGKNYFYYNSGCDVTVEPFSAEKSDAGWVNSLGYLKDSGYRIDNLHPLLYVLAATEPGRFFLGAVRQTDANSRQFVVDDVNSTENTTTEEPDVNFFTESVAFFPYFDNAGRFNVAVFEGGKELTLEAFMKKYSGSHVHLVRINASERFFPQ